MIRPNLVYLAGPIDDVDRGIAMEWRESIAAEWPDVMFFNPVTAYHNVSNVTFPAVDWCNRQIIAGCDGLLANLSGKGRGFGTIREIEFARQHNKVVAVAGLSYESLMSWDLHVYSTVDDAASDLIAKIVERRNQPQTFFGMPIVLHHPDDPQPEET